MNWIELETDYNLCNIIKCDERKLSSYTSFKFQFYRMGAIMKMKRRVEEYNEGIRKVSHQRTGYSSSVESIHYNIQMSRYKRVGTKRVATAEESFKAAIAWKKWLICIKHARENLLTTDEFQ